MYRSGDSGSSSSSDANFHPVERDDVAGQGGGKGSVGGASGGGSSGSSSSSSSGSSAFFSIVTADIPEAGSGVYVGFPLQLNANMQPWYIVEIREIPHIRRVICLCDIRY